MMRSLLTTTRRDRLVRQRQRNRRRAEALKRAGLVHISLWVQKKCIEAAYQRASVTQVHRQTVLRAALEVGLQRLTTSDILCIEQRWRGIIGLPVAPRYAGERFDRTKACDLPAWQRSQRAAVTGAFPNAAPLARPPVATKPVSKKQESTLT